MKGLAKYGGFGHSLPPDVVIKNRGEYEAVMDAKWTMTGPKMGHFYQMVAYMTVMQVDTGVLVYPELDDDHRRFWTKAGKEVVALELPIRRSDLRSQYSFEEWLRAEFEGRLQDSIYAEKEQIRLDN